MYELCGCRLEASCSGACNTMLYCPLHRYTSPGKQLTAMAHVTSCMAWVACCSCQLLRLLCCSLECCDVLTKQ
jgi:hypothetical protein